MLHVAQDRDELATCGMGNKVKVWDVKRPTAIRQKLVLNHGTHGQFHTVLLVYRTARLLALP